MKPHPTRDGEPLYVHIRKVIALKVRLPLEPGRCGKRLGTGSHGRGPGD